MQAEKEEIFMRFSDQDYSHSLWMLANQIDTVFDLVALWLLFPNEVKNCPYPDLTDGVWFAGLERAIEKTA
jgi:hypothetical protein